MNDLLQSFPTVSLLQMQEVSLQDRVELKYVVPVTILPAYLQQLATSHKVLCMDGSTQFGYTTHYYDAPDFRLYLDHHNGYANRIKVRRRLYDHTGDCFFEIKRKVHGIRTEKTRIAIPSLHGPLASEETRLINYPHLRQSMLEPRLINTFNRITLCNNELTERITIDTAISMNANSGYKRMDGMALIEIKQQNHSVQSKAIAPLRAIGLRSGPFSKYALGMAYLHGQLKHNNFKPIILNLASYAR